MVNGYGQGLAAGGWRRLVAAAAVAVAVGWGTVARGAEPAAVAAKAEAAKALLASWSFDDDYGDACQDGSGNGLVATPGHGGRGLSRVDGVSGQAMAFSGDVHLLATAAGKPSFDGLRQLSFSAWVQPTDLSRYREILRQENGDSRVLFSFQADGSILSLGLNVGGYVECDAPLDPKSVLDGQWHHAAATFDGEVMRVYLDGREIGAVPRPGTISAGGDAPLCIGSMNGGETFQGALDEVCVYREALTAAAVAALHQQGRESLAQAETEATAGEPAVDAPVVAHWRFNAARGPLRDAAANPALDVAVGPGVGRGRGVHGRALELSGSHALAMAAGLPFPEAPAGVSFCAWVRPTAFDQYNEIFRQECGERLLFSFQERGTILSLGLNVGGYEECDAPLKPEQVLDGQWHHAAATFDGTTMRVYLDDREIGTLSRPGRVALNRTAPCFIGSSGGTGEFHHGGLDDLRVYAAALTAAQVGELHQAGRAAMAEILRQLEARVGTVYVAGASLGETLARTRQALREKGIRLDREMAGVVGRRLQEAFPEAFRDYAALTGTSPVDCLVAVERDALRRQAERWIGLLTEYRPLTPEQVRRQSAEEQAAWAEAERIEARYQALVAQGDAGLDSPAWVEIVLEAGRRVHLRPYRSEAVAPYIKPETPVTRDLSADEARQALERDWLHQAGNNPTPERIGQEIGWARDLAARLHAAAPERADFAGDLAALAELEPQAAALKAADPALYLRVREVKRRIAFANPVVDFGGVLFVDMPYPQGSEWPHETRHRLGYMAVPGARLLTLTGLSPAGHLTQLMPQAPLHGSFWRPDLSVDGKRVLFCFKPHNEKSFHTYEINVDGSGLRQITDGPYDDLDPVYLPDGRHIVFSTTRGHTYVRCMPPTNAYVLARCDLDGQNLYLISANNEPDYLASVMPDGRLLYTRWEYTDKPLWRAQGLWTLRPDGTQVNTLWGNQSVWPDLMKDARAIPGSPRVMFTGSAHHGWFSGSVGIVDSRRGYNFPNGLTKVTADTEWPECGNGPQDPVESPRYHASGGYGAYYSPYPLSEKDFLVSANRNGKFVLYLMDVDGNRELVYEGTHHIFHALPLAARPLPAVLDDLAQWPTKEERQAPKGGVLFSANVYEGAPAELRGHAKFLRVLSIDHKTYTYWYQRPYLSTGPVVSGVQSEGVKRVLGTVPVAEDGSVSLEVPAGLALHVQLLDGEQRALQTMRSFVWVMPGERRGCLGCHELHSVTPALSAKARVRQREPQALTPPPWGEDTVSYPRYVRPVLDRTCGRCHQGEGEGRKRFDQTAKPGFLGWDEVYWTLIGRPSWGAAPPKQDSVPPGWGIADMIAVEAYDTRDPQAYVTPEPMTRLSYRSRLVEIASSGKHHDVRVSAEDRLRLILWVDTMCPYLGDEEVRAIPDPEFQGVDWLAVRPRIQTAPRITRPGPLEP